MAPPNVPNLYRKPRLPLFFVPEWMESGACRRDDAAELREVLNLMFAEQGGNADTDVARLMCKTCDHEAVCLQYALDNHEKGVWGATTERQRQRLRADHRRPISA